MSANGSDGAPDWRIPVYYAVYAAGQKWSEEKQRWLRNQQWEGPYRTKGRAQGIRPGCGTAVVERAKAAGWDGREGRPKLFSSEGHVITSDLSSPIEKDRGLNPAAYQDAAVTTVNREHFRTYLDGIARGEVKVRASTAASPPAVG